MTETIESSAQISAEDLLDLTTGKDYWTTKEVPELQLRSLRFADGPHGLRMQNEENPDHLGLERSDVATCFPPAVTLASSWDLDLVQEVGAAYGREARAAGVDVILGPGLNIKRSPLCGRNFEYYAEDPLLTGMLAGANARGIQAEGVAACLKHFAANNQETDRLRVSANIDERTLREIYLRAFQITLRESNAWSVMSSYNRINGTYASENEWLLTTVLRDEWKFDGVVISDWGGVTDPVAAVNAGLDVRMPGRPGDKRLLAGLADGKLEKNTLLKTASRLALLAERTGGEGGKIDLQAQHEIVRRAAAESAVLMVNDGSLPIELAPGLRIAVIGELGRSARYQGAGSSRVNTRPVRSGLDVLTERAEAAGATVSFSAGYALDAGVEQAPLLDAAFALASRSDVVVLFLGLPGDYEAEGSDRHDIELPESQKMLVEKLQGTGVPTVVAMSNGSAVSTVDWRDGVNAIVEFWLTGQAHGEAIADVLLGDVNPSGRLAETIPLRVEDTPSYLNFPGEAQNVTYGEGIYVGYRYYEAKGLDVDFPFGHGLSYTSFEYSDLKVEVRDGSDATALVAKLRVKNTGSRKGKDVVQLYVGYQSAAIHTPPIELRGWKKVSCLPGEAVDVEIPIARQDLEHWSTAAGKWVFEGGKLDVYLGASSRDLRLCETVDVPGEPIRVLLSCWSSLGEWLDHPVLGDQLRDLIAQGGGLKGRIADLLSDSRGKESVRASPLIAIAEFPGVPLELDAIEELVVAQG